MHREGHHANDMGRHPWQLTFSLAWLLTGDQATVKTTKSEQLSTSITGTCHANKLSDWRTRRSSKRLKHDTHTQHGRANMLVLSRKLGQEIVIGGNITIQVVDIRGENVRLGIVAPKDVSVHRREVFDAILDQHRQLRGEGLR